ncbi:hypothetical protein BGZ58_002946 [Dissophora ornata]|nr:hypothetical protein BGZ58_002946 [Dissophora ornata]
MRDLETHGRHGARFRLHFVGDKDHVDDEGVQWKTLCTLMSENGRDWIDILKVDIEGFEYPTFNAMMYDFDVLPFSQLQIEIHADKKSIRFDDFLTWWQKLESKGLRPFWTEVNLYTALNYKTPWASEYSFINIRGASCKNLLLRDYEN